MNRFIAAVGCVAVALAAGPGHATRRDPDPDPDYRAFAPQAAGNPLPGAARLRALAAGGGTVSPTRPPPPSPAGAAPADAAVSVQKDLYPFLRKHCLSCHNDVTGSAKPSLTDFQDAAAVRKNRAAWLDVVTLTADGSMPPANSPRPHPKDVERFTQKARRVLDDK